MRPITKALLGLVAVVGIVQSLAVMALTWPVTAVRAWLLLYWQPLHWVLFGLAAFVGLAFLIMLLAAVLTRSTTTNLVLANDRGDLSVSKQAVENAVAKSVAATHPVKGVAVAATMHKSAVKKAEIDAYSLEPTDLKAQAEAIKQTAHDKLEQMLGVPVKQIKVHLHPGAAASGKTARVL
ncbi:alkaline shock response membrane anchor protein AmaP [Lacticaseibacillus jixianensis]|uniref:Alkaline shock response membrane anchor protein AmaP n=1 Tax=Lacticaseibacillus jixianensis TaxID=2486012 RepID=A0ABW4B8Z7_9LACO|nr:alkaline shock response membrane anchor protein AmaP [Lacticaseibacillus jixianensis]